MNVQKNSEPKLTIWDKIDKFLQCLTVFAAFVWLNSGFVLLYFNEMWAGAAFTIFTAHIIVLALLED